MQIIRLTEVLIRTGLSRASVYRLIKSNQFPSRRQLSKKSVGWLNSDIDSWIESRPMAS